MKKPFTIIENGDILDISVSERNLLLNDGLIYHCPDCGENIYHLDGDILFSQVDSYLWLNS